jgi:hypothetical protein
MWRRSWAASLCDLIDHSEIVIHFSRAEIQSGGAFGVNRLLSLNLWRAQFGSLFFQGRHRRCVSCILSIGSYRHQHETSDAANCNHKNHKDLLRNEPYCADRNKCSFHRLPCGLNSALNYITPRAAQRPGRLGSVTAEALLS